MARAVWRFAQVEWLVDRATVSPDALPLLLCEGEGGMAEKSAAESG